MEKLYDEIPPPLSPSKGGQATFSPSEGGQGEELDDFTENLERLNFLSWYRDATPEDMEIARRNNAEKLDELMDKYKTDITFMSILQGD